MRPQFKKVMLICLAILWLEGGVECSKAQVSSLSLILEIKDRFEQNDNLLRISNLAREQTIFKLDVRESRTTLDIECFGEHRRLAHGPIWSVVL